MLRKFVNRYAMVLVIGSLLVFLTGCGSSADKENTGAIKLNISAKNGTKSMLPDIDMTPAKYNVTGSGPDSAVFVLSITDVSVEIPELAFGAWVVTVDALNADDKLIARGSGNFTVHTGETTPAEIIVTPLEGNGTLDITIQWNNEDTEVPLIEAQLINADEEVQDLTFTINGDGNTATFSDTTIPAGYYILNVKLLDNNIYTMGAVEIVRIVDGETTTGNFNFNEINKPGGNILINIIADMEEPIEVTMSEIPEEIAKGTTMSVISSVPDGLENIKYIWFINGEQKHIGSSAAPSYDIPVETLKTGGVYRIDVVALTMDGKRGGSATDSFKVTEMTTWARLYKAVEGAENLESAGIGGWLISDNFMGVGCSDIDSDEDVEHYVVHNFKLDSNGAFEWAKVYDNGVPGAIISPFVVSSVASNDGGMVNLIMGSEPEAVGVMKVDVSGNVVWNKVIENAQYDQYSAIQMRKVNGGFFICMGFTDTDNKINMSFMRISDDGEINLNIAILNESDDRFITGGYVPYYNIIDTNYNGYLVSYSISKDSFIKIKLNSEFSIQWQRKYESNGERKNLIDSEIKTESGGSLLAGYFQTNTLSSSNLLLLMLRDDGTIEWQKRFEKSISSIKIMPAGDEYILAGQGNDNDEAFLSKLSNTGSVNWAKTYGVSGGLDIGPVNKAGNYGYLFSGIGIFDADDGEDVTGGLLIFQTDLNGDIANIKPELNITSFDPDIINASVNSNELTTSTMVNYNTVIVSDTTGTSLIPVDPSTYTYTDVPPEVIDQIEIMDLCN